MLRARIRVFDYLDLEPLGGVSLEFFASVVVRYPPRSGSAADPLEIQRLGFESVTAETDAAGWVDLAFDLDALFTRAEGIPRYDAVATLDARVSVAGFSEIFSLYDGNALVRPGTDPAAGILARDDEFVWQVLVDLAKSIVGSTGSTHTTILFALTDNTRGGEYECHLLGTDLGHAGLADAFKLRSLVDAELGGPADPVPDAGAELLTLAGALRDRHRTDVRFDEEGSWTAAVRFEGLRAGRTYRYELRRLASGSGTGPDAERVVASGSVRLAEADPRSIRFVFGSCHFPADPDGFDTGDPLERWEHLARRDDYDFMLLVGDQVYADEVPHHDDRGSNLRAWFVRTYHGQWVYRSMRQVLRRTPTYMIFDDHEVDDDWGVDPVDEEAARAALYAYGLFQESAGPAARRTDGRHHYGFAWGRLAAFVLDCRSRRTLLPRGQAAERAAVDTRESVVLGEAQLRDLEAWADSEALAADVVVIVASVPMAFLPVEQLRELGREIVDAGENLGTLVGAVVGGLVLGLPGIFLGGIGGRLLFGHVAQDKVDAAGLGDLAKRDLRDLWTWAPNQPDLRRVLDVAFRLGNDADRGGRSKRAVLLLGGDVHAGALHHVVSMASGENGGPSHEAAPIAFHLISSPISKPPTIDAEFSRAVKHIRRGVDVGILDLVASVGSGVIDKKKLVKRVLGDEDPASFPLDRDLGDDPRYAAEFIDLLTERNYGEVGLLRTGERRYEVDLSIHGTHRSIHDVFDLDLEALRVLPTRLRRVRGIVGWLRVHRLGTGYGPPQDMLDAEAVVRLEGMGDRVFGLTLRDEERGEPHRAMLAVLRRSLRDGRPVDLEYEPTSARAGIILRVEMAA